MSGDAFSFFLTEINKLNEIEGVMIPAEATGRWSSISLMVLEGEAVLRRFPGCLIGLLSRSKQPKMPMDGDDGS